MDPFEVLGIERRYVVDVRAVEKRHRELSRTLHPDRYVNGGASERRDALTKAVDVNEAWRVVRDPIRRAEALLTLAGVQVGDAHEPKPEGSLLMEMMEAREALEEARGKKDGARVGALVTEMTSKQEAAEAALAKGFDEARGDAARLAPLVPMLGVLRYYRRFLEEASAVKDDLETLS